MKEITAQNYFPTNIHRKYQKQHDPHNGTLVSPHLLISFLLSFISFISFSFPFPLLDYILLSVEIYYSAKSHSSVDICHKRTSVACLMRAIHLRSKRNTTSKSAGPFEVSFSNHENYTFTLILPRVQGTFRPKFESTPLYTRPIPTFLHDIYHFHYYFCHSLYP